MSGPPLPPPSPPAEAEPNIKVLVVDDIPETRENLRKLLYFESDIEVVGAATDGNEGVQMAEELRPDVVLMDINMPGMDGIAASELITRRSPGTQVIIMSVQGEADYLRRSMLAGAREFLIKPFSGNELITSVRRVYELGAEIRERESRMSQMGGLAQPLAAAKPEKRGKIVSIFSPKGGVGCSTLAINLAVAMHKAASIKVCVVDTSLQFGDISVLLNQRPKTTIADLASLTEEDMDIDLIEQILITHNSGIKALLAPPRPEMADLVTSDTIVAALKKMRQMFDMIIVDTYSSLQDIVINVLDVSDKIILVTTPEIPSVKSARLFFEVTDALEYPPDKTTLILNKADRRVGISAEQIEAAVKSKVEAKLPLDERTMIKAVNEGTPYIMSVSNSDLTKATVNFAQNLYKSVSKPAEVS